MMTFPPGDGFIMALEKGRPASVTFTASDDLGIVADAVRARAAEVGIAVRLWPNGTDSWSVEARL